MAGTFLTDYFGPHAEIKLELPRFLYDEVETDGDDICRLELDAEGMALGAALRSVRYKY